MWVKEQSKGENKEKCVNGAIVPDSEAITVGQVWYIPDYRKYSTSYLRGEMVCLWWERREKQSDVLHRGECHCGDMTLF